MSRPKSLKEVALLTLTRAVKFDAAIESFLVEFESQGRPLSAFTDEPPYTQFDPEIEKGQLYDAALAAIAEYYCAKVSVDAPEWCQLETRFLADPWFALDSDEGHIHLMEVAPAAFKKRNVFIPASSFEVPTEK